ncbi:glycosyltransferase [Clostridium sp. 19966]|uniref:glycosyltransferase n=1 Tax=Clostridium sp. 19966 TaxID=2768166 RepID=UPI0028DFB380|nr:glycosyltransferase [Clostridium sp. 19966]MDT8716144.1 glycosyltransferase [Clostridium sp. 19966]
MIKVSVLMLVYNHEKYIEQALQSILMQKTNFQYEIVIGEDCSKDKSREIIEKYEKMYPKVIKLIKHSKNIGPALNFMSAYKACIGEYIAMIEGDDFWVTDDKLQKQVDFLDSNIGYSGCFTNANVIYEESPEDNELFIKKIKKNHFSTNDLLIKNVIPNLTTLARRSIVQEFPEWYSKLFIGDWPLHIMRSKYGEWSYIDDVTSTYRKHIGGISNKSGTPIWYNNIISMYININNFLDCKYDKIIRKQLAKYYAYQSMAYMKINDFKEAKKCYFESYNYSIIDKYSLYVRSKCMAYYILKILHLK